MLHILKTKSVTASKDTKIYKQWFVTLFSLNKSVTKTKASKTCYTFYKIKSVTPGQHIKNKRYTFFQKLVTADKTTKIQY